jgi:SH3 domain protein
MLERALLALVLGGFAIAAAAETAYVTDSLRLGIHRAADTSDQAFDNLLSGTAVEVVERNGNYARVRLEDGREGWVRTMFLVTTKPAAARILELEAQVGHLEGAVTAAKEAEVAAEQELARLTNTTGAAEAIQDTVKRLQAENRAYEERFETYRNTLPLTWVVPAVVVALVAGFLAGLWWLDARIRRRHGGFRVY